MMASGQIKERASVLQSKTLKCQVVCELAANADTPITNVSENIGYFEPPNFTRFFRSRPGMTPRQYRNNRRPENEAR